MSRSDYSDACDGWDLIRWRGAVRASIRGRRGQELLHGLRSALDAMPEKRLIANSLIDETGDTCALGALGVACGVIDKLRAVEAEDYEQVARVFGVSEALVREIAFENDERYGDTPETRWNRMRAWAERNIQKDEGQPQP